MATIPDTDISLATQVRDVLNAAGGTVNNNLSSLFTHEAGINMWSKHKPVVLAEDFPDYGSDWWRGERGNCGITPVVVYNTTELLHAYDNGEAEWSYRIPRGGENEPLRLGDFRGYCTDALPPVHDFSVDDEVCVGGTVTASLAILSKFGSLSLADIALTDSGGLQVGMDGLKLGFVITDGEGTPVRVVAGDRDGVSMTIPPSIQAGTEITAYPFFCDFNIPESDHLPTVPVPGENPEPAEIRTLWTVPHVSPQTIRVIADPDVAYVQIGLTVNTTFLRVGYTVEVRSEQTRTLTDNVIELRSVAAPEDITERQTPLGAITLNAGEAWTRSGSFPIIDADRMYYVRVCLGNGAYIKTADVDPLPAPVNE